MALENNFYQEIHIKEQKWIELIEKNLLNIYYFEAELLPFYTKKVKELTYEYNLTNNSILGEIIQILNNIIKRIEELGNAYRSGLVIDTTTLVPLFLTSNFNNNIKKENTDDLQKLYIRKQVLNAIKDHYSLKNNKKTDDDYLYDDFPEEVKRIK